MIVAQSLHKRFPTGVLGWGTPVEVLKGFDFQAHPGTITGILGANGAGKTTFFRIMAGLESYDSGTLTVDGIDPRLDPQSMRGRVALLPEDPGLHSHDCGRDHLTLFGIMSGLSAAENKRRLQESDDLLQLSKFWKRQFRTYSRGQKARISLARLHFFSHASVLIFDEPSNGLDFESVARLHAFIRQKAKDGCTVLVSSHIVNDLKKLCDRVVGVQDGRVAEAGVVERWLAMHGDQTQQVPHDAA